MISLEVDSVKQKLLLFSDGRLDKIYPVSTAKNGLGETNNSFCTPRGLHEVYELIGADAPINTVFVGRKPTGEIFSEDLQRLAPDRDWILTRIIWLSGLESGLNLGGAVDTKDRYIYIHGTPDGYPMGVPESKGCVRMRNADIVELFDKIDRGTLVKIY